MKCKIQPDITMLRRSEILLTRLRRLHPYVFTFNQTDFMNDVIVKRQTVFF